MNIVVEKVGERDGAERFALVNQKTGDTITKSDVSEETLRKYLAKAGETDKLIEECFRKARKRYDKSQDSENGEDLDDIFLEMGLDDEAADG